MLEGTSTFGWTGKGQGRSGLSEDWAAVSRGPESAMGLDKYRGSGQERIAGTRAGLDEGTVEAHGCHCHFPPVPVPL